MAAVNAAPELAASAGSMLAWSKWVDAQTGKIVIEVVDLGCAHEWIGVLPHIQAPRMDGSEWEDF